MPMLHVQVKETCLVSGVVLYDSGLNSINPSGWLHVVQQMMVESVPEEREEWSSCV